jgi:hypothetical protein
MEKVEETPERFRDYNSGRYSEAHIQLLKHKIKKVLPNQDVKLEIAERLSKMDFDELENRADILCDTTLTNNTKIELLMIKEIMVAFIEDKKQK